MLTLSHPHTFSEGICIRREAGWSSPAPLRTPSTVHEPVGVYTDAGVGGCGAQRGVGATHIA